MRAAPSQKRSGFTLVELLVVVGIIALLISILLPVLGKARSAAQSAVCLSNLHQLGLATAMYVDEHRGYLPYPTSTEGEEMLWFNVLDPYLVKAADPSRSGVAGGRTYARFKQCPIYDTFSSDKDATGAQGTTREYSRTYKMNSMLRHNDPYSQAKITEAKDPANFVYIGDGVSMDTTGDIPTQWENGQFSMEVNDSTQANPALRHSGGANILFVDGHAQNVKLKTITKHFRSPENYIKVQSWESEFVDGGGHPDDLPDHRKSAEDQGYQRNPNMPLIWSLPGKLYR